MLDKHPPILLPTGQVLLNRFNEFFTCTHKRLATSCLRSVPFTPRPPDSIHAPNHVDQFALWARSWFYIFFEMHLRTVLIERLVHVFDLELFALIVIHGVRVVFKS